MCFSKWYFLSPDPVVASLAQDIFKELAQIEACQGPMQMRLIPTLVSIMQAPADKIPAGLCAVSASVGHGLGWRCSLFCYTQGGCSAKGRKAAVDVLWSDGFSHWGRFVCGKKANCRCRKMLPKVCFKLLLWPSSSLHSISHPQSFCCDIAIFQQEQSPLPAGYTTFPCTSS